MTGKLLHQGRYTKVYLSEHADFDTPVVCKMLDVAFPDAQQTLNFYQEYHLTKNLDIPGVRKVLSTGRMDGRHAIFLEYIPAVSLHEAFANKRPDIPDFLEIAIHIARLLTQLHQQKIIHKDINGGNLLWDQKAGSVFLIDFSIAATTQLKHIHLGNPENLEGSLAYISPEQTGRMNRLIDHRSDLYALGATFYELLAGRPPFLTADPLELIHAHIALQPIPLRQVNPAVPEVVEEIVHRLMAKNPEDRYQSAAGLCYDLELCRDQWEQAGSLPPFELGEKDHSGILNIPDKLFGRKREIELLLDSYDRACGGRREWLLVTGASGTGKSALVSEVYKRMAAHGSYFISGKFEQYQLNLPYSAIIEACRQWVGLVLMENESSLEQWKQRIKIALGDQGQLLTDLIPELSLLTGSQPPVPELEGQESRNRLNYLFQRFFQTLNALEHPLIFFIDDLQWADEASVELLRLLLRDHDNHHLMLIGSYRENEVGTTHMLARTITALEEEGIWPQRILLDNLDRQATAELVREALAGTGNEVEALAGMVHEKTLGNAFFTRQFLRSLYEEDLLRFDFQARAWKWDQDKIRQAQITDNVVELLAGKVMRLPPSSQLALKQAASIGNTFRLADLGLILNRPWVEIAHTLWQAVGEGFLVPVGEASLLYETEGIDISGLEHSYRFSHDRVRQAVYSLIPETERKTIHRNIGELFLRHAEAEVSGIRFQNIANHLNVARDQFVTQEERLKLAELNLSAGRQAKKSAAFTNAFSYFHTGLEVLPEQAWDHAYRLCLSLHEEAANTAFITSDYETVERLVDEILIHAREGLDTTSAYYTLRGAYRLQGKMTLAVDTGVKALKLLDIHFPPNPRLPHIILASLDLKRRLPSTKNIMQLLDLPVATHPKHRAILRMIEGIESAAYLGGHPLMPLIMMKHVRLSLDYGNDPTSIQAYIGYAILMCGIIGDLEAGYQYGQLSARLTEKFGPAAEEINPKQMFVNICLIRHWKERLAELVYEFRDNQQVARTVGDLEVVGSAAGYMYSFLFLLGESFSRYKTQMHEEIRLLDEMKHYEAYWKTRCVAQAVENLQKGEGKSWVLKGAFFDEETQLDTLLSSQDKSALGILYYLKTWLAYLHREPEVALEIDESPNTYADALVSTPFVPAASMVASLTRLAVAEKRTGAARKKLLQAVRKNQKQLRKWAMFGKQNYLQKYYLVEAERARISGKPAIARDCYDRAITCARKNEFLSDEALAWELGGRFFLAQEQGQQAGVYLQQAYESYLGWEAVSKAEALMEEFPFLISPLNAEGATFTKNSGTTHSEQSLGARLDMESMMRASHTISGEIVLAELLKRLMEIVIENAGAQKGYLIMRDGAELRIQAHSAMGSDAAAVMQGIPVVGSGLLPESVVQYVERSRESILLHDAGQVERFSSDPYIRMASPQSVLCMPIVHQGKLLAIFYMENNLSTGAFTQERIELLRVLSGQIAVSIHNAMLYARLEETVVARTEELVRQKDALEQTLDQLKTTQAQLVESEKMASLGQLTAGIAHEMNNPVNFITANIHTLRMDFEDLLSLLEQYSLLEKAEDKAVVLQRIQAYKQEIESEYLFEEIRQLLDGIDEGATRTSEIVAGLRNFSRLDEADYKLVDLHVGIDATLALVNEKIGTHIQVHKQYGDIPEIECLPGKINQVIMNLLNNAIQAIEGPGEIYIATQLKGQEVLLSVRDTGNGMSAEVEKRVFEPFFTTKAPGEGTGLGLSISYGIITNHQGTIEVRSERGQGAEFLVRLPFRQSNTGRKIRA